MLCGAIINFTSCWHELIYSISKVSSFGQELPMTMVVLLFLNSAMKSRVLSFSKIATTLSKRVSPERVTLVFPSCVISFFEFSF